MRVKVIVKLYRCKPVLKLSVPAGDMRSAIATKQVQVAISGQLEGGLIFNGYICRYTAHRERRARHH